MRGRAASGHSRRRPVIVEEHTAVVEARLEAMALGPAAVGGAFRARLRMGGKVVRAVALGPGRAVLEPERRRSHESRSGRNRGGLCLALLLAAAQSAHGGKKHTSATPAAKATPPEDGLRAYIERVRAQQAAEVRTPGSIWSPEGQMVRLGTDVKAFRMHDVV